MPHRAGPFRYGHAATTVCQRQPLLRRGLAPPPPASCNPRQAVTRRPFRPPALDGGQGAPPCLRTRRVSGRPRQTRGAGQSDGRRGVPAPVRQPRPGGAQTAAVTTRPPACDSTTRRTSTRIELPIIDPFSTLQSLTPAIADDCHGDQDQWSRPEPALVLGLAARGQEADRVGRAASAPAPTVPAAARLPAAGVDARDPLT